MNARIWLIVLILGVGFQFSCGDDKPTPGNNATNNPTNNGTNNPTNNGTNNPSNNSNNTAPLPDEALSRDLPEGAIEITAEELMWGIGEERLVPISIATLRAERLSRKAQEEADETTIAEYVAQFPDLEFDPNDLTTIREPDHDGNHSFVWRNANQIEQTSNLLGAYWAKRSLVKTIERFPLEENQFAIYDNLYANLPLDIINSLELPDPEERTINPSLFTVEKLSEYVTSVVELGPSIVPGQFDFGPRPGEKPFRCEDEIGAGTGGDRFLSAGSPDPAGLLATYEWKQKWNHTCVKNQHDRGTCSAMSTISAIEHLVARKHKEWVNLSEQWLYNRMMFEWNRNDYGDGYWVTDLAANLEAESTPIPFEQVWNYNISDHRTTGVQECYVSQCGGAPCAACDEDITNHFYRRSCVDYFEICGNATHQSRMKCASTAPIVWQCAFEAVPEMNPDRLGYSSKDYSNLLDVSNRAMSLDRTLINLAIGSPVVISVPLYTSFWDATANRGFVPMPDHSREVIEGWHAMHVLTYVDNFRRPDADPPFPFGPDGGWFIVKNSWGTGFGDGGYVYMSYRYVKRYAVEIVAFQDLHP